MNDIYVYIIPTNCELTTNLPGFPWNHIYLTSFGGGLLSSSLPCVKSAIQCCEYQPKSIVLENHFGNGHGQKIGRSHWYGVQFYRIRFWQAMFFFLSPSRFCHVEQIVCHPILGIQKGPPIAVLRGSNHHGVVPNPLACLQVGLGMHNLPYTEQ